MKRKCFFIALTTMLFVLVLSSCVFYGDYYETTPSGYFYRTDKAVPYDYDGRYELDSNGYLSSLSNSKIRFYLREDGYLILLSTDNKEDETLGTYSWDEKNRILSCREEFYFKKM